MAIATFVIAALCDSGLSPCSLLFYFCCLTVVTIAALSVVNDDICRFVSQLVKLAKRLRKEKVNVDVVNFGEEVCLSVCLFVSVCAVVCLCICLYLCSY